MTAERTRSLSGESPCRGGGAAAAAAKELRSFLMRALMLMIRLLGARRRLGPGLGLGLGFGG